MLKCEIIKKIFKFIFPLIDSPMKESSDCPYKLVWCGEWTYLIHPSCLIELCLFQDRENNSGLGWCGQRRIRGCIRRNDTGFPYNNPICAAPHVGIWWEGVLAFKEVYPAWQISFYRNLMPLKCNAPIKQTKGACGKERNSKQCNRCNKIFSSHYICRDHDNSTNVQLYDPNSLLHLLNSV